MATVSSWTARYLTTLPRCTPAPCPASVQPSLLNLFFTLQSKSSSQKPYLTMWSTHLPIIYHHTHLLNSTMASHFGEGKDLDASRQVKARCGVGSTKLPSLSPLCAPHWDLCFSHFWSSCFFSWAHICLPTPKNVCTLFFPSDIFNLYLLPDLSTLI